MQILTHKLNVSEILVLFKARNCEVAFYSTLTYNTNLKSQHLYQTCTPALQQKYPLKIQKCINNLGFLKNKPHIQHNFHQYHL